MKRNYIKIYLPLDEKESNNIINEINKIVKKFHQKIQIYNGSEEVI